MPFGMVNGVRRGMRVLDWGGDRGRGMGSFAGEFGTSHCNQWGLCCIVAVADPGGVQTPALLIRVPFLKKIYVQNMSFMQLQLSITISGNA